MKGNLLARVRDGKNEAMDMIIANPLNIEGDVRSLSHPSAIEVKTSKTSIYMSNTASPREASGHIAMSK